MTTGYEALRNGAAWLDLSARGRLEARGRDRARFLHNVTSNEVKKMTPGDSCYAFLLTAQGRIVADLELYCLEDRFLIDTEPETREKVLRHILKYKVADQVELTDVTEATASVGVEGPAAETFAAPSGLLRAPFRVTGQPGFRLYCETAAISGVVQALEAAGASAATPEDARAVRLENGKPRYGEDILETSLPQETGQMHAVSFTKGCYLGQEIVERIRARGRVNRELVRFELDGTEPVAPGTRLQVDGRETEVTSSVVSPFSGKTIALGYARVLAQP
jgi:tRNA-modifying protein YgfZ